MSIKESQELMEHIYYLSTMSISLVYVGTDVKILKDWDTIRYRR